MESLVRPGTLLNFKFKFFNSISAGSIEPISSILDEIKFDSTSNLL